jgi:diguanylate cyclase (GGDEF)-like protein
MASERLRGKTSPEFQKAASQPILSTDKEGNTQLNPEYSSTTLAHDVVASAPSTIATGLGAGGIMKVGGKVLSPILSRLGIDEVVSANFPKLASMAETMFPGAGSSASKVNKMIATGVAAKGGASVSEGLVAAGQNSYQKRQEIKQTPFEKLEPSPVYQAEFSKTDASLPIERRRELARNSIADMAADDVFHQTFASTGGISLATGGGVIGDVLSKGGGKITGAFIKSMGKGAAEEAIQEFPQSGAEKAISNIADKKYVDPNKDVMEGVADAALKGAVAGAATGGGLGGISHLSPSSKEAIDSGKTTDSVVVGGVEAKITSGSAKNLYNKYNQLHATNPDPNDPGYTKTKDEVISSLDKLIAPKEGKEIDPVLKGEVDAIKASINSGHDLLSKQDQRMKEEESIKQGATEEAVKPIEPAPQVESIAPDSSVVTGEDLVSEPTSSMADESNISPDELKELMDGQSISASVAESSPKDFKDKRYNFAKRQAYSQLQVQRKQNEIDDLSSKLHQANTELRTHPLTLLPNKRAFTEQENPKVVASIDIDSLKYLNDTLGHEGGDALLKSVTSVLGKYVDAYHISGDEILARGTSKEELVQGLEKAYAELQSGQHTIDTPTHTFSSPSFSYGISEVTDNLESAIKQADLSMLDAKALREKAGDRAARGEMPRGFSEKIVGNPSVPSEPTVTSPTTLPLPAVSEGVASPVEPNQVVSKEVASKDYANSLLDYIDSEENRKAPIDLMQTRFRTKSRVELANERIDNVNRQIEEHETELANLKGDNSRSAKKYSKVLAEDLADLNNQLNSYNSILGELKNRDNSDSRKSAVKGYVQSVRDELDHSIKTGEITPEKAKSIVSEASGISDPIIAADSVQSKLDANVQPLQSEIANKISKLQAIANKTKNGEEVDWNRDWEEGSPIASLGEGRLVAAAKEITDLQAQLASLKSDKPISSKDKPTKSKAAPKAAQKTFHSSIDKGYEGSANLSTLTTAKLPEIISAKFPDLTGVPIVVSRSTKNTVVVRAAYTTSNGTVQLTKEFSIPREMVNDPGVSSEPVSTKELVTPVAAPVPLETFEPVDTTPVEANPIDERLNELKAQLDDARITRDFELMRELKQEIEDLGGSVDKVKLDQKKINANLAAEKMEDEESDEAIDNLYGDKESYTNVNGDDVDVEYSLDAKGPNIKYQNHEENKKALDYIFSKMKGSAVGNMISSGDLKIYYVPDFEDSEYNWPNAIRRENAQVSFSPRARGIHTRDNSNNITYIFLNGAKAKDPGTIVRTFAHEVIGHYGIRSIFGQSKSQLDNYLVRLINSNQAFRESIFSKKERWISYYNSYVHEYMRLNDIKEFGTAVSSISKLPASEVVMYKGGPVPIDVAIQLADEEMAEIAADLFFSEKFLQNQVGLGDRTARKAKSDIRKGWLNSFLNRVKHLIRKVFGSYTNEISTQDLTQMIAESVDRLFETTPISHLKAPPAVRREFIYENVIRDTRTPLSIKRGLEVQADMDELTNEDIVHNEYTTEPLIRNINSFVEASVSSDTNLNENVRSKMWGRLIDSIKNSRLRGLLVYSDMPHSEVYSHIDTVYKGGVGRIEDTARTLVKALSNINSIQNAQIFEYMTTASANPDIMQITDEQKKAVIDVKEAIKELGRVSAELGIIDKVAYEKNADAYLHTTYLDFVSAYKGSGKRTSTMSYSFKKKDKTERQRAELGQIKDVRFLIPETFGVLARDHVLLEMFSTINEASTTSDLHWVLSSKEKIKLPGTKKQATVEDAYKYLDNLRYIYEQRSSGNDMIFGEETRAVPLALIKNDLDTLETDLKALEQRLVTAAHKASGRTDLTTEEFLRENYVRLPTSKKLGGLSSKFVRKEIANDLEAFTAAYNIDNATTLQKFFARGGTLERMNSFWKTGKIALNPASWFRNIVGNFSLLDLSTSTPSHKLVGMLHEEISRAIDSKQTDGEYWTLAKHYGLFGTTFSAIELQSFFNNYGDELTKARVAREKRTDSAWDKQLTHFDEMLGPIFKMAGHKLGGSTAKGFAFVEGAFKTVAFRDYVQTWEKQNGMSYKDLVGEKQNVLLAKAASHANDAIIDYSKAHAIVKDLRRLPFGDPFLTFTYKSLPIMLKSMVNHPIKFAKYATLPALLTTIALAANDWEDKDWERIQKGMTDYHRDNPGMFLYPWKDKTGRMQIADAGYLIPWNQWHVAAKKAYRVYAEDGGESPFAATGKALYNVSNELGFMGGPAPQAVAAFITGKDSFTGQDIAKPGTSADQKIMDYMKYAYNMAVPGWLSSSGWFSKLASAYGINSAGKPEVDRFGDIKFTPGQAISDITGFRAVGVNPETGIQNRMLGFDKQLREISTTRSKMIRDQNLSSIDKQTKLKEFAFREKLIRKQMQEAR